MGILIDNRQSRVKVKLKRIQQKAQAILNALDNPDSELSILIVDDSAIAELNETYLNRKGPTNVIAFPMQEGEFTGVNPGLLGDVVISVDTAEKEAEMGEMTAEQRFDELLVHGILHLLGYDHETDEADAAMMEVKSRELMDIINNR